MCKLRMSLLESSTLYTYGVFFIACGIIATVGNLLSLYILLSERKSKSNKILSSLAISDTLTGLVVFPLNTYQSFSKTAQSNCTVDLARSCFSLVLIGSSVLTLVVVAIDRYILMTKFASYDNIVTRRRIDVVMLVCWLLPALIASLRIVSPPSGILPKIYEGLMIFILFGPVLPLALSYCLLVRLIYLSSKKMNVYTLKKSYSQRVSPNGNFERVELGNPSSNDKVADSNESQSNERTLNNEKNEKRHLKLAKSVAILLGCYFICLIPFNIWIILDSTKSFEPYLLQQLYIFGILAGAVNSCINPFIYLSKKPGFQKKFRQIIQNILFQNSSSV